jgi:hypothetical protein
MDRRTPYTLSVLAPSTDGKEESRTQIQAKLRGFILEFQLDNAFIYRYAALPICNIAATLTYISETSFGRMCS